MNTPTPPDATPPGCTHYRLRQLLRHISRLYDAELAQAGLKATQYSLLAQLRALGPVAPSVLAARLGLDASTLTRNLRPLIARGLVHQGPGVDARSRQVTLTPEGRCVLEAARFHWQRAQQTLEARLGEQEVAALHAWIERAQARLTEDGRPPEPAP